MKKLEEQSGRLRRAQPEVTVPAIRRRMEAAVAAFAGNANAMDGLRSIYRQCKPLLAIGSGATVQRAGLPASEEEDFALVVVGRKQAEPGAAAFAKAIGAARNFARESNPPRVKRACVIWEVLLRGPPHEPEADAMAGDAAHARRHLVRRFPQGASPALGLLALPGQLSRVGGPGRVGRGVDGGRAAILPGGNGHPGSTEDPGPAVMSRH